MRSTGIEKVRGGARARSLDTSISRVPEDKTRVQMLRAWMTSGGREREERSTRVRVDGP